MNYDFYEAIVFTRMGERVLLTVIIIAISITLMVAFWKRVQRIQFEVTQKEIGIKADAIFAMPVFLLLTLVLFAYVSFSSTVQVTRGGESFAGGSTETVTASAEDPLPKDDSQSSVTFSGFGSITGSDVPLYLRALDRAQATLGDSDDQTDRQASSFLKLLQRGMVLDYYGQELVDNCKIQEKGNSKSSECEDVLKWVK